MKLVYGSLTEIPSLPAIITAVVIPQKSPWSTTPTVFLISLAMATGSLIASLKCKSTM